MTRAPELRALCDIYQQEKDWNKAIAMAQRLENATGKRLNAVIAQYYCELRSRPVSITMTARRCK